MKFTQHTLFVLCMKQESLGDVVYIGLPEVGNKFMIGGKPNFE